MYDTHTHTSQWFAGWWFGTSILFSHILGISSSQLTNIFQRGSNHQPAMVWLNMLLRHLFMVNSGFMIVLPTWKFMKPSQVHLAWYLADISRKKTGELWSCWDVCFWEETICRNAGAAGALATTWHRAMLISEKKKKHGSSHQRRTPKLAGWLISWRILWKKRMICFGILPG